MVTIILLVFSVLSLVAAWDIRVIGNPTLKNEEDYLPRPTYLTTPTIGHYNPVCYFSRNPDGEPFSPGVYGSIQTGGDSYQPPAIQIAYFTNGSAFPAKNPVSGSVNCLNGDYTVSDGYALTSYARLEEINETGVAQNLPLNTLPWTLSKVLLHGDDANTTTVIFTGGEGGYNSMNYNNKNFALQKNLTLKFIATVSQKTVQLPSGNVVTSQSIKSTMEIFNFSYKAPENYLRLQICVALSPAHTFSEVSRYETERSIRLSAGEGPSAVFFDLDKTAYCDGVRCEKIDIAENTSAVVTDFLNWKFASFQVTPMLSKGRNLNLRCFKLSFPPGVKNITYDPALGVGEGPELFTFSEEDDRGWFSGDLSSGKFIAVAIGTSAVGVLFLVLAALLIRRYISLRKGGDENAPLMSTDINSPAKGYHAVPEGTPEKAEGDNITPENPGLPEMVSTPEKEKE